MFFKKIKTGFSLIEVNMAILIAAGGMLSIFALFPIGLRQSVMSEADLHQATFASSFFEAIAANVKKIDIIERNSAQPGAPAWNEIDDFWATAIKGTGLDKDTTQTLLKPEAVKSKVAEATGDILRNDDDKPLNTEAQKLRFVYREEDRESQTSANLKLPPQLLIRIRTITNNRGLSPNGYAISLVSSHEFSPAIYSHNTVYSMEFYFRRRP